jgi:hypothetical protein
MGRKELAPKGALLFLEATFVPLEAAALVACFAARRALATDGRPGVFPLLNRGGARLGHQLGQQCCPIQNMANSATQYKRPTLSCALRLRVEKKRDEQALPGPPVTAIFANVPRSNWIMGWPLAQWAMMAPLPQFALPSPR